MRARPLLLSPIVALTGCLGPVWQDVEAHFTDTATTTTSAATAAGTTMTATAATDAAPTTSAGTVEPVATVTGPPDEPDGTSSTSLAPEENQAPVIESFSVTPGHVSEAGAALLHLEASADTAVVRLGLNGEPLAELTPADFPFEYEVLSAKFNFGHVFEAVAVDPEGLESAPATTALTVNVPASGVEKCIFEDQGAALSLIAAVAYTDDALVAVGTRDAGDGARLALWILDPDTCQGVAKSIANWTGIAGLASKVSGGTAVAVDADGDIFVAGFTLDGIKPRRYLAMLNPDGARLWEDQGGAGEEIAGLALAPKPQATLFAVGWRRSSDEPIRTDAAIWIYKPDGTAFPPDYLKAPLTPDEQEDEFNERSERLRAVAFEPSTGLAFAVGDREFKGKDLKIYNRSFLVRVHPLAGQMGEPWTSPGEFFAHDAALGLGICGQALVAAGWRRDPAPGAEPAPMLQWFSTAGAPVGIRPVPLSSALLRGVACDRELKSVSAGASTLGAGDTKVLAADGVDGPMTWYETGVVGADEGLAVACDHRGFCAWGGFRTDAGLRYAVVRVHHP